MKVYGGSALEKFGICKWIGRFTEGRDTVKDDHKSGRPSTSVTDKIITDVQQHVKKDDHKSGRPSTSVTDKIITDVQQHVKQNHRVTVREISKTFSISYGSAQEILTDKFGMSLVCARWVPRVLTPEHLGVRDEICSEFLERVRAEGSNFTDHIVTCEETWVHFYEPEYKQQSSVVYGNIQHRRPLLKPNFLSQLVKLCVSCFSLLNGFF